MSLTWSELDDRAVTMARALAMDAVQKVGNGHPGTAMSLAPAAYLLFQRYLRHDPAYPTWIGRDRFVLSAGHSSLTLYIQLFLSGYELGLADLQTFRTWGSRTPGHPEHGHTAGVETTTGPLGQGISTAVGMAMAARFHRGLLDPDRPADEVSPFDHRVFVIASDGDLEEGVSAEASSLAGTQRLQNLIVIWDNNRISIEGDTQLAFTEDVCGRYAAYGWDTHTVPTRPDGSVDVAGLAAALDRAVAAGRPTFISLESVIAWPAPNAQGTAKSHGSALGSAEVAATKEVLGLDPAVDFAVDEPALAHAREAAARGAAARKAWEQVMADWRTAHPERAALLQRLVAGELPAGLEAALPTFETGASVATRAASGKVLNALAGHLPELWGGSADLAESNNTTIEGAASFLPADSAIPGASPAGRVLHFGIREHAMGAVLNGIALEGLTRPFGGTFLVFSDYMRGAVRLAAIMQTRVIYVWTHDSIGLGEDGPTHQPVETLWGLRAIPGLAIVRPADATETAQAWLSALKRGTPVGLALTRQGVPVLDRSVLSPASGTARGAYVLRDPDGAVDAIVLATGSEVALALAAADLLAPEGIGVRVVSAPCLEWFEEQDERYRDEVLPPAIRARVSVEAGIAQGWWKYVGDAGRCVSLEHFGASADAGTLFREFGFTPEAVAQSVRDSLADARR